MVSLCEGVGSLLGILASHYGGERCLRGDVPSYAAVLAAQDDLQASDLEDALAILDGALRLDVTFVVENDGPGGARNIVVTLPTYDESFRLDELEPGATGSFGFVAEIPAQVFSDFMPLVKEQSFVLEWDNEPTTRWLFFWLIVLVWAVVIVAVAEREVGDPTDIDGILDDGQLQLRLPDAAETPRADG